MKTLFYNGNIHTLDALNTCVSAVGVEDGKIIYVGKDADVLFHEYDETIDLKGKLMLPGFVDSHLHMLGYAFVEKSVKLFDTKSVEECIALAKDWHDHSETKLSWMYCRGWNEEHFSEPRYPHKDELDCISKDIPIIMVRVCGHIAVCNSCGLQRLKQIPTYGEIECDVDEETGLIKENAVQFFHSILSAPTQEEVESYIKFSMQKLNEGGFTGIQSDDLASLPGKNWRRVLASFKALDAKDEMSLRVYEQCLFERIEDGKAFINEGYRTGQRGNFFTIGPMKLLQDGSLGAGTAALNEPYASNPDNRGIAIYTQEELDDLFAFFDAHDMQAAVHCIGDRAMDMVIEAIAKSEKRKENKKNRHGIVHAQITNARILSLMKQHDVLAYVQPVFVDLDMNIVEKQIGSYRMDKVYAWKSMLDLGIHTSGGSDAPVVSFNVMENIYFAHTMRNIEGNPKEGWIPSERMSIEEAVRMFTTYPAYASYSEDVNGSLEVDKYADMVVLEKDIFTIDAEEIKTCNIDMTIVNGKIVYKRD